MTENGFMDETLMAYADGLLPADEARQIETAIARDPKLAARVQAFRDSATRLKALADSHDDSVPPSLIAHIHKLAAEEPAEQQKSAQVVDIAARREPARVPVWQLPVAAGLFFALGLLGAMVFRDGSVETDQLQLAVLSGEGMQQALRSLPSGQRQPLPGGGEVQVIASFTDGDGQLCREFEYDRPDRQTIVSVACHADRGDNTQDGWAMQMAILAAPSSDTGYAPASSLETLDAYLAAVQAGAPLSPEDEAAALERLRSGS